MKLSLPFLFNPQGDDSLEHRQMFLGNSTNIMNLNNVRYRWAVSLYRQMRENFWVAEKVDLTTDQSDYRALSVAERRAFDGIVGYLTYLDSIQTHNLPVLARYITAPEVRLCLAEHASQEALHNQSYQYLIETLIPAERRNTIYDLWRTDPVLLRRTGFIAELYQQFWNDQSVSSYFAALCANYLLEGLYFYNGFIFFYSLAARGLMSGTASMIRYIQRDELTHVRLFQKILKEAEQVFGLDLASTLVPMTAQAVEEEIHWSTYILEGVPAMTPDSIVSYTQHLANLRLRALELKPLYANVSNPFVAFERVGDISSEGLLKGNFFESTVTAYNQSSVLTGWSEVGSMAL